MKPNVIVFFTDQQRFDSTGVHGNPLDLTPNFDRMATTGTHLAHAYTTQPVCGPARACLQTGKYATATGCWRNGIPLGTDHQTLAHHFGKAGYQTGYIGKWHLGSNRLAVDASERGGYKDWLGANALEASSQSFHTVVYDQDNQPIKLPGYRVDALTDAAISFVNRHQKTPFFLFLSHLEPHFQNHLDAYPAPPGYEQRYRSRWIPPDLMALGGSSHQHIGGYWGMVKRLDEALGRLNDALYSLGLLENTIVLFTTDHGCHFKTRNAEYKRSCHDSSIRIPTALSGPGFEGGGHVEHMIEMTDFAPTLLDACGLDVPSDMQGRSILPLVWNRKTDWREEAFVQISESHVGRAVRTHRWKYSVRAREPDVVVGSHADTYVEDALYDMEHDPYELNNLIGLTSHRRTADRMKQRLLFRIEQAEGMQPTIIDANPRPAGQKVVFDGEENL